MQLIGSYTSPFVRKIRILLEEKGLPFSFLEDIPWNADTRASDFNPLGKVPILIDEDGSTWYDSPVIAEYLEAKHSKKRFIPLNPIAAVQVRQLEALADGVTEAGIAIFLEKKRDLNQQNPGWITRQQGKLSNGLDTLEKTIGERVFLHVDGYSVADIAAGASLGWLDFRLPGLSWREGRPRLAELAERLFAMPAFQSTMPPATG